MRHASNFQIPGSFLQKQKKNTKHEEKVRKRSVYIQGNKNKK